MKASELRKKSAKQLQEELLGLLKEQFNLRTQRGVGQVTQTHQFRNIRRDVARVMLILSEMQEGSSV